MTDDAFLKIKRSNLESMQRDLYKLKREKEEEFNKWLKMKGEFLTATYTQWAVFRAKCVEYKELWAKVQRVAKGVEE